MFFFIFDLYFYAFYFNVYIYSVLDLIIFISYIVSFLHILFDIFSFFSFIFKFITCDYFFQFWHFNNCILSCYIILHIL